MQKVFLTFFSGHLKRDRDRNAGGHFKTMNVPVTGGCDRMEGKWQDLHYQEIYIMEKVH